MTNYNDGNWHVHQGGARPVGKSDIVEITYADGCVRTDVRAGDFTWSEPLMFRVTKEHKEPREFWLATRCSGDDGRVLDAEPDSDGYYCNVIHVREVID